MAQLDDEIEPPADNPIERDGEDDSDDKLAQEILEQVRSVKLREEKLRKVWTLVYQYMNNWVDGQLGQWKRDWRDQLEGRPMLSFNEIRKFINRISFAQSMAKADEKAFPRDDNSDPLIAEILTDLKSFVYYLNNSDELKAKAFRDCVVTGRGFIKACWDTENDPMGEITHKRISPFKMYLIGDMEEYDLSKYEAVIDEDSVTLPDLVNKYPQFKDKLNAMKSEIDKDGGVTFGGYDYNPVNNISYDEEVYSLDDSEPRYKILRRQKYEWTDVAFINTPDNGLQEIAPDLLKQMMAINPKFPVIRQRVKKVKIQTICGSVVLGNVVSNYKHNKYDIVSWICYNDGGLHTGVGQDLLDPQNEKNKRRSQVVHMTGTAVKNGYFLKKGAVDDVESTKKEMGRISPIIEINGNINEAMKPIEGNLTAIPALVNLELQSEADMKNITGLSDASLGIVPQGVKSGRGINQLQQPAEMLVGGLMEHNYLSCKLLAQLTIGLIQQYYDEPKRVRILGNYSQRFIPPQLQQQIQAGVASVEEGAKIITINTNELNDVTKGKYDVVINTTSANPTTRMAEYYDLLNMKSQGAPIPWSDIMRLSPMRGSQEMAGIMAQQEAMLAQMSGMPTGVVGGGSNGSQPAPEDLSRNLGGSQH